MTLEELRKAVEEVSATQEAPSTTDIAIMGTLRQLDEKASRRGGPMGRDAIPYDLEVDRDIIPLDDEFVRVSHVERIDNANGVPWGLSPATFVQWTQAGKRNARGGFWCLGNMDTLLIYPKPTAAFADGLRVWGYRKHAFDLNADANTPVDVPERSIELVIWLSAAQLAIDPMKLQRAMRNAQALMVSWTGYTEIPHSGTPPAVMTIGR